MKIKTAVMTGLTGLALTMGLDTAASAQTIRVYREAPVQRYGYGYTTTSSNRWQAQQIVRDAYRDILQREPDSGGLRQYTNAMLREGWSANQVRQSLLNSDEYAQRFGRYSRYNRGLGYQRSYRRY